MPHLDADRLSAWEGMRRATFRIERFVDAALRAEWAVPLAWFEVLAALRTMNGAARPADLALALGIPPSSLSRRVDRIEEEGWVLRRPEVDASDLRAVDVELTPSGRKLWREMNVTYRRAVQQAFAAKLDGPAIAAVLHVVDSLTQE